MKFLYILLLTVSLSVSGVELKSFRYYKDATSNRSNSQAVSVITLDSEVFNNTSNLYSGLRISNGEEQEIPFALRRAFISNTKKTQHVFPCTIENLKKAENTVVITVKQREEGKAIDSIDIKTSSKNFEKKLSISGSNDQKTWREIISNRVIYDYSSIIPLRKTAVDIPRSNYKYFRISIDNFSEDKTSPIHNIIKEKQANGGGVKEITSVIKRKIHIKIDSVNLINISRTKTNSVLKEKSYPLTVSAIETKDKKTVIDLKSSFEPLTEIKLSTSSTNFSRNIILETSDDNKKWGRIASGNWGKSNIFNRKSNGGSISFLESRHKFYRITVQNGDNPELKDIKVYALGNIYRAIMLGKQELKLRLYYGGSASYPQYEISRILPEALDFDEINYTLSEQKTNPLFDDSVFAPETDYKWLFTVIIILISVILIFVLYKNLGKLNTLEDSAEDPTNKAE